MGLPERDIAQAKGFVASPGYQRCRPEATLLCQLVAEHYPAFRDRRVAERRPLPRSVLAGALSLCATGPVGTGTPAPMRL